MARLIADSGPLLAALNRRERDHGLAAELLGRARAGVLVSDPVITEVDGLARVRLGGAAARQFLASVAAGVHTRTTLTDAQWRRAIALDEQYAGLALGLVDASLMALAEDTGLPVLTFDFRDFRAVTTRDGAPFPLVLDEADLDGGAGGAAG